MKKIACVGYHATGAGVIDDLFREFDNVAQGKYEVETRLLQDPDGISDLEFNLVENPHRHNSGFAIKRYLKYADRMHRMYNNIFGKKWMEITKEYADSLIKLDYKGYWFGDLWLISPFWKYLLLFRRAYAKLMPKRFRTPAYHNYFPWLHTYHVSITEEEFLHKTRTYIDSLCDALNVNNREYVLLDQILSPSNPERYVRYVNDLKVIIVDRDPRDVYVNQKNAKEHTLPMTPHEFCVVYKDIRKQPKNIPSNCLYVTFEQMVLDYDNMVQKVLDFVGIDKSHHIYPKTFFNPQKSINGVESWKRFPEFSEDIAIIEKELPEFINLYKK